MIELVALRAYILPGSHSDQTLLSPIKRAKHEEEAKRTEWRGINVGELQARLAAK